MTITKFLQEAKKFEIQAYKRPRDFKSMKENCVSFMGAPLKHPYDKTKVIIVADPYSSNTFYFEFKTEDIAFVEELPNLVNTEGETITMARVWVKKRRIGVRCTPFLVEDINFIVSEC